MGLAERGQSLVGEPDAAIGAAAIHAQEIPGQFRPKMVFAVPARADHKACGARTKVL
jgi:hypothetical protein